MRRSIIALALSFTAITTFAGINGTKTTFSKQVKPILKHEDHPNNCTVSVQTGGYTYVATAPTCDEAYQAIKKAAKL